MSSGPAGRGSLFEVKRNGKRVGWRAEIWVKGRRFTKQYPQKTAARDWLRAMTKEKFEVEAGVRAERGTNEAVTHAELEGQLLDWLRSGTDRVRTESTMQGYKTELRKVLERWGEVRVMDVTKADVNAWIQEMRDAELSTSTIRNRLGRLSQLHQIAVENGHIGERPCKIPLPRMTLKSRRGVMDDETFGKLLEAAGHDRRARAIILLASDAGLRATEIARLRGEDVDLERGWIHVAVRSEKDRTKSGKGRWVPILTPELSEALEALSPQPGVPILVNVRSYQGVRYILQPLFKAVTGEAKMRLHELRHRFVTKLLEGNESADRVRQWAGHSMLRTTQAYSHVSSEPTDNARSALAHSTHTPRRGSGARKSGRKRMGHVKPVSD